MLARLGWKTPRGLGDSRGLRGREAAERPGQAAAWTGRSPPCSSALSANAQKNRIAGCRGEPSWPLTPEDREHQRRRALSGEGFRGRHRALPQGVGAAPVHWPVALGLNATPQAPAGVLNLEADSGSPRTSQLVWSLAEALELALLIFAEELPCFRARIGTKLCKGFVRTIMWFPHTSEPWLAGSRAPRAAVGRRVCPVRAIPASRMLIARHLPEHALIGGRPEATLRWRFPAGSRHCSLSDVLPGRAHALVVDEPAIRVD